MPHTFTVTTRPFRRDWWDASFVVISKAPGEHPQPDGTTSHSMGFPVAVLTDMVGDGEAVAKLIADLLTEHYAKAEGQDQ